MNELKIIASELKLIKRDGHGLIEGVQYKFTEDGLIDWRAMINPKYLYINIDNYKRRGTETPDSIEGVADKDLIIGLGGLKDLGMLRGYTSVTYRPIAASTEYAATTCQISWIGNYETDMESIVFEDSACANTYNTSELVQSYLIEMATNRAFARCLRNFLRISIMSKEEMPPTKIKPNNGVNKSAPSSVLASLMKEKGRTFEEMKEKLIKEGETSFEKYKNWEDVPGDKVFQLINRFKSLRTNLTS